MRSFILASVAIATLGTALPAAATPIGQREQRQEQRIRQGEASGQLTPAEARRLQFLEARLQRTEARMRARNGGRLDAAQRHRLQQMANQDSRAIARLKHNGRVM